MGIGTNTLDCVANALESAGVGQQTSAAQDWFIVQGYMPDGDPNQDRIIAIYETPGEAPLQRWAIDYPSVAVHIRGAEGDYQVLRDKMQAAFLALHEQEGALTDGTTGAPINFVYFYAKQSAPISMGTDERMRQKMAWNFRSMRNRSQ